MKSEVDVYRYVMILELDEDHIQSHEKKASKDEKKIREILEPGDMENVDTKIMEVKRTGNYDWVKSIRPGI